MKISSAVQRNDRCPNAHPNCQMLNSVVKTTFPIHQLYPLWAYRINWPRTASTWTGRDGALNKSHLIGLLTRLLTQRWAASRNNRPLPSQTVCESSDGHTVKSWRAVQRTSFPQYDSGWIETKKEASPFPPFVYPLKPTSVRPPVALNPRKSRRLLLPLMLSDRSHLFPTPAAHLLSPTIWWRAKTVICPSLLTNHCAVKSAFCLPQPWKQLQSACIPAVIALHISLATLHWWWNWKADLPHTVNERYWKFF